MLIVFDYEIRFISGDLSMDYPMKGSSIMETYRTFVKERLSVLNDQIEKEPKGFTVIYVWGVAAIEHYGFSEELKLKLYNCITDDDREYLKGLMVRNFKGGK
jgi:hypothetical protein